MPTVISAAAGAGRHYANPFIQGPVAVISVPIALSTMTTGEIDAQGMLKPGVPVGLNAGATYEKIAATKFVRGVTLEAVKVAADNAAGTIAALGTQDIAIGCIGMVNRKQMENSLGRVLTAAEIAGFTLAGSLVGLVA